MKIGHIRWVFSLSLVLLVAFGTVAQDSLESRKVSAIEKGSIDDSLVSGLGTDTVKGESLPNKSAQTKENISKDVKSGPSNIKKLSGADTLVVKTESSEKDQLLGENKIQDLSKLLSSSNIFYTVIFLLFGFLFIRIITYILNALAERSTKYRIAFKGSIPIVKIIGWVIIITLIIVVIYKPSVASMLAVSASIGVAIGFASQDILKNIFGGIVILLDRPFVAGDKIEVDKYYGEVVEIGLRSTRIVTPDDSLVSVPNAVMMNSSLSNANAGEPNCQVVAEIFLPLTVDTIQTREIATQAATVSKYIYLGKPITILFLNEVNNTNTYYKMKVKAYVMDIRDEFRFKSDMTELIITELVKEGILTGKF